MVYLDFLRRQNLRFVTAMLLVVSCFLIVGCGPRKVPVSETEAATKLVEETFEAWKGGSTPDEMRAKKPPVYVTEPLWSNGDVLQSYSIVGNGEIQGTNVAFVIKIKTKDKKGKVSEGQFTYLVTTTPAKTVIRNELEAR